jgi:hypothetical protein
MALARNTCRRVVGRLLEIRLDAGYRSLADVDEMSVLIRGVLNVLPARERVIIAADWRHCTVMGKGIAERTVAMFAIANARALRSGILVMPDSPTTVMQLMRLASESQLADRRVFTSPDAHAAWLEEVTTPQEQARLRVFVARSDEGTQRVTLPR